MKIEELSIGDWVVAKLAKWESDDADTTPPLRVKCIYGIERHNLYVDLFNPTTNTIEHSAFVEDLIPIPLTPEILKINGWREDKIDSNFFATDEVYIYNHEGVWRLRPKSTELLIVVDIKHVHELQHALRLLGVEKEIEL